MSELITFSKGELKDLIISISAEVARNLMPISQVCDNKFLPEKIPDEKYYRFPEDIYIMLDGKVKEKTIQNWGALGYLKVTKFGQKAFVSIGNWQWFKKNHGPLMAKDSRR